MNTTGMDGKINVAKDSDKKTQSLTVQVSFHVVDQDRFPGDKDYELITQVQFTRIEGSNSAFQDHFHKAMELKLFLL